MTDEQIAGANLRAFLDGVDAAREGEMWLQTHITDEMRHGWPHNKARVERYQCGGDNHMAVLWLGLRPLASFTVLRDDFNRSKLLLWVSSDAGMSMCDATRSFIEGMTVSVDVSTGEHDAGPEFGCAEELDAAIRAAMKAKP